MDQERFDRIARAVSSGASRRKVLGGAIAGLFGASVAAVAGTEAKGKKGRKRKNRSKGRGKKAKGLRAEQIIGDCAAAVDPTCAGCCAPNPVSPTGFSCVANGTSGIAGAFCGVDGAACVVAGAANCCTEDGLAVATPLGSCGGGAGLCTPCPNGCCEGPAAGQGECIENGSGEGVCGINGTVCVPAPTNSCCDADGLVVPPPAQSVAECGAGSELCEVCTGTNATCVSGNCQATPDPTCPVGLTECPQDGGVCVNLATNPDNCGDCGIVCSCGRKKRPICAGGACKCRRKRRKKRRRRRK